MSETIRTGMHFVPLFSFFSPNTGCNANCFDGEGALAPACDPEEAGQLCQCSGCVPTQYGSQFPGITEQCEFALICIYINDVFM
jgi:hypothetical protein